jgi:hypothetical protein
MAKTAAWTRSEGKNKTGGLNAKGVASYRAANPGSKLKMAVTTKPSKLDPNGKAAKRRKSFCARSAGQMAPKAAKDPNSRLRFGIVDMPFLLEFARIYLLYYNKESSEAKSI